jgi:archaellum component FlaC
MSMDLYYFEDILNNFKKLDSDIDKLKSYNKKMINDILSAYTQQMEYIQYLEEHIEKIHNELSKCTK